ncbi:MAG: hypothetical protein WC378_07900 [Opitutaceae bacterium]|jgi:hypothetical protein
MKTFPFSILVCSAVVMPAFAGHATLYRDSLVGPRHALPRHSKTMKLATLFLFLVASAYAQYLTVSGGGTISLGQSANIVASPTTGIATAYSLIENGVVVQTIGTFGIGGSSTDVGKPHTFTVTPPAPGTYVYSAQVALNVFRGHLDYVPSNNSVTLTVVAPPNHAPTVVWTSTPGKVETGQSYTISVHGHDDDGNLTAVSIWKNGQPFAFAGGGNGTDGDSQNPTVDTGPVIVTFTAQAFDASGASSAIVTQTVTIAAPNHAPTISWNTTPGTVASGQNYIISAHGRDQDGNLTQVNVWKNGQPFAFAGGGTGTDGDSGNPSTDTGPQTITYTAQAVDASGSASAVITQTVTVSPPNHAPTISWNTTPGTVASGQSYTISAHGHDQDGNLTQVNVWRNGSPYAFAGGGNGYDGDSGNPSTDTGPQTVTYTARAVDANGATSATISQTVTISAPLPAQYTLTTVAGTGGSVTPGGTFTAGTAVAATATPDALHTFANWSGDASGAANPVNVTMDRNRTVQANFSLRTFTLTTTATTGGTVSPGGAYSAGASATVTATPAANYYFVGWTGDLSGSANPASLTMNANRSVQAVFGAVTFTLSTSAGPGGSVSSGGAFSAGTNTTVTATPDSTHNFAGWSGDASGTANPLSVTLDRNKSVQANFSLKTFTLTTSATTGGTVSSGGTYSVGSSVSVAATPAANYYFVGWTGDLSGSTNPSNVTMNANRSVQAVFAQVTFTLVALAGPGGSVSAGGTFAAGTNAIVVATPDSTHDFVGWSGDAGGATNPLSLTIDRNKTVQANFSLKTFTLTTAATTGGTVTPGGQYPLGTIVTISAMPDATHRFIGWSGDATGTATSVAITLDRAKSVVGSFAAKLAQTITFAPPGDLATTATATPLNAAASSGLPVTFIVVSGPATITNGAVLVIGPGSVVIQATQAGNDIYLPASPVVQTFNVVTPVQLKFNPAAHTLLDSAAARSGEPLVIQVP